jgi:hypothetical protein
VIVYRAMNGFVLVDMLSGQCIFSMMFEAGFGLGSLQGGGQMEEATVAAHFAGMSFSLMLQAVNLVGGEVEPTTSASRRTYLDDVRDRPELVNEASNAAPMLLMEAVEGTSLCFFLHPELPLLAAVSTTSATSRLGSWVAEAVVRLFVTGHARSYFTTGQHGTKALRKALSAPIKAMYKELLAQEVGTQCREQLEGADSGVGEWHLTVALDPSSQGFTSSSDTQCALLFGRSSAVGHRSVAWGDVLVGGRTEVDGLMDTAGLMLLDPVDHVASAVTRDPSGLCSVVLCNRSFAAMLSIVPSPTLDQFLSPDVAALHCSWAEGQFSLWAAIFQFAHTHRLHLLAPRVAS